MASNTAWLAHTCGRKNKPGAAFCSKCGQALTTAATPTPATGTVVVTLTPATGAGGATPPPTPVGTGAGPAAVPTAAEAALAAENARLDAERVRLEAALVAAQAAAQQRAQRQTPAWVKTIWDAMTRGPRWLLGVGKGLGGCLLGLFSIVITVGILILAVLAIWWSVAFFIPALPDPGEVFSGQGAYPDTAPAADLRPGTDPEVGTEFVPPPSAVTVDDVIVDLRSLGCSTDEQINAWLAMGHDQWFVRDAQQRILDDNGGLTPAGRNYFYGEEFGLGNRQAILSFCPGSNIPE